MNLIARIDRSMKTPRTSEERKAIHRFFLLAGALAIIALAGGLGLAADGFMGLLTLSGFAAVCLLFIVVASTLAMMTEDELIILALAGLIVAVLTSLYLFFMIGSAFVAIFIGGDSQTILAWAGYALASVVAAAVIFGIGAMTLPGAWRIVRSGYRALVRPASRNESLIHE